MKRIIPNFPSQVTLVAIFTFCLSACSEDAYYYYVSSDGSDRNPGTIDKPFATISRARDAVRELKMRQKRPITVFVRAGTYYLSDPIVFRPEDSGTEDQPITYAAYPREIPTLSGGTAIVAQWQPYHDGIMKASLRGAGQDKLNFDQLFVNGKRQIRARYPDDDPTEPGRSGYSYAAGADKWPHKAIYYDTKMFSTKIWRKPLGAVLHIFPKHYWGNLQWEIKSVDYGKRMIHLGKGGWQLNEIYQRSDASGISDQSRFYVENVFEELDAPGEWYMHKESGDLYYKPAKDVRMNGTKFEVAILRQLIELRGSKENPVRHVRFSGFRITQTATTFLEEYDKPSLGDWAVHRGGAMFIEGAEDCIIERCYFDAVGGNGIFINNHSRRIRIYGNKFTGAGESAVCLVGKSHLDLNGTQSCSFCGAEHQWKWGEPRGEYSADCVISNNLIHDIGVFGKQTAGVFVSLGMNNIVSHNHIYNVPRAAICFNDGSWGGHIIEFNDIHNTVRETGDHGPFNSWGRGPFWCHRQSHGPSSHAAGNVKADAVQITIIRNNRFRDQRGWGIDLDDGSSNYHVYNNLCIGVSIKLREGDHRTVENNIFVNPANPPGFHVGYENNSDKFVKNIIVVNTRFDNPESDVNFNPGLGEGDIYKIIYPPIKGDLISECDYNLFTNDKGHFTVSVTPRGQKQWWVSGKRYTLNQWQALGYDRHSLYGDPMFVDPRNGDYTVKPESPALKLAFKNFPMDQFGLLPDFPRAWRAK